MNLKEDQISKIDPLLEEALMNARGDENIRVIMTLGDENQLRNSQTLPILEPGNFSSSIAYRQALIERRKNQLSQVIGDTIQELQNLSLKPVGGTMSRVVVVEGSAIDILNSLELSGVNNVSLDQLVGLPEVAPDEAVNHFAELYIKILGIELDQKTKKLIYQASKQYILNYQKRYNRLRVLGMSQSVNLDDIYTEVQCLEPDDLWHFESLTALERNYRQNGSRRLINEKSARQNGITIANQCQYLMILGQPGAGKSTFLRKIGLEALKGNSKQIRGKYIPVLIELKQFTGNEVNIFNIITNEFLSCQLPQAEAFTNQLLNQGKLLLLFDGLDEVPNKNFELVINKIQEFVKQYHQNKFIISCRTAAYRQKFNDFNEFIIADFDDQQIQQFINNWFYSEVDKKLGTAEKCWNKINSEEATRELARTPLLLTFLCLEYDESQDLPKKKATLYGNALDILLRRWASEKRLPYEPIYRQLGIDLEKIMLAEIAYDNFAKDKLFFSQTQVLNQIQKFLDNNDNAPKNLDAGKILDAITIEQGILVERARDVFSFSHLTLQEYLTAQYIDDHRLIEKLVTEHLTDERWKEVFLLVAGVMRGGTDDLLLFMEKEVQKYINTGKLQDLLNWAENVTVGSQGDYKPVGKRAVAIAISNLIIDAKDESFTRKYGFYNNCFLYANLIVYANSINTGHEYAYIIAMIEANKGCISDAIDYTHQLKELAIFNKVNFTMLINRLEEIKSKVPDEYQLEEVNLKEFTSFNNLKSIILTDTPEGVKATVAPDKYPSEEAQIFINILMEILINGFNLTPEMINLSQEEIKALDNYLYANYLIIQCKEAAVRVSPATWEAIEARMLLVGSN
ncbi:NACHT domain-containing protein [Dolichospermum circinale]|uniref:NACHT domain-containing protein n=1 Tax=Dolichospermum circinale TaxID=109265 RepID=UPI00232EA5EA|nr:NACHT domain-containing protein [Dolichospermum circinale]MDB9449280.1 NACHT domain-containing protein [Dolichospermum circinale CS-547]